MKHLFSVLLLILNLIPIHAQQKDSLKSGEKNIADRLLSSVSRLTLGGYGEVHYNQPLSSKTIDNGTLDVHRMVLLMGYNFNSKTQFITEIEFEHVSELFIEQAFLQYKLKSYLNFRAGLMLIPMGIVNEYHEPTSFNGVERPFIDTRISPTTWREIGIGITGNILATSMKYQLYLVNGFSGYNGEAQLNGKTGFRNGRQKGAESFISVPNITGKVEYYGLKGLNLGISGYYGKTQSNLYDGIDKDDPTAVSRADSSVTGLTMIGLDARYQTGGLQMRGQLYYSVVSNTSRYNEFTAVDGINNDLGSAMWGYYLEAGYDVLHFNKHSETELVIFTRYEKCDTHYSTSGGLPRNKSYNNLIITSGFSLKLVKGAIIKTDIQFVKPEASSVFTTTFNAGIGVMF